MTSERKQFRDFPNKRMKAVDGMAVTADVWEEAHEYHHQRQRYHNLLSHRMGIITGLEVKASDPADSSVYVHPGFALDGYGNVISVPEPVVFDFAAARGMLHLILTYGESQPRQEKEGDNLHIFSEFGIEAVTRLPESPYIELARVLRTGDSAIRDAGMAEFPAVNEIDLRFRLDAIPGGAKSARLAYLAVCYAGQPALGHHGRGMQMLARAMRREGWRAWVDDCVPMDATLEKYTLVYLVGQPGFQLSRDEMNALYAFIRSGGTVFMETCQTGEAGQDQAFLELANVLGMPLTRISSGHPLFTEPYLFPTGEGPVEIEGHPRLLASEGIILSASDFGCLWQGQYKGQLARREIVRSSEEWGVNLLSYALKRRQEVHD